MKPKLYIGRYKGRVQEFHPDKDGDFNSFDCVVEFILDGSLKLSYPDSGGEQVWSGREIAEGHWELSASMGKGKATLHQIAPQSHFLEGTWNDDGYFGMWRITLPVDTDDHHV